LAAGAEPDEGERRGMWKVFRQCASGPTTPDFPDQERPDAGQGRLGEQLHDPGSRLWRALFLAAVLCVSLTYHWNTYSTHISPASFTIDSSFYVDLARNIERAWKGKDHFFDPLRTPGYPALFLLAAWDTGVDLETVSMPPLEPSALNEPGRRLVERVLLYQQLMAAAFPVLIFLTFLALSGNGLIAFLVSFAYYTDLPTVSYQHVVLAEFSSIVLLWLALWLFVLSMRRPALWRCLLCGLALGLGVMVRPALALFAPCLALGLFLGLARHETRLARVRQAGLLLATSAALPLCWGLVHLVFGIGHFVVTTNAVFTMQLFAGPRLVAMDVSNDPQLETLKRNVLAYKYGGGESDFVFTEAQEQTMRDLGMTDYYDYYQLKRRACWLTIRAYPGDFFRLAREKFAVFWNDPFYYVINPYALDTTARLAFFPLVAPQHRQMLFGRATFWIFLALSLALLALQPGRGHRACVAALAASVLVLTVVTTTIGMDEPDRHTMQARTLINALSLYALAMLAARAALAIPALRTRQVRLGQAFTAASLLLVCGSLALPFWRDYHRSLADLTQLRGALERYREDTGGYPATSEWSGVLTPEGVERRQWIPGLVPTWLSQLPRDPRRSANPLEQYLYRSDGREYKLIAHGAIDCPRIEARQPGLVDPQRRCFAYGFWTAGARDW